MTGIDLQLNRIEVVLESLNNPHHRFLSIHVSGTNGKGSVTSLLNQILIKAGLRVGLFQSPHLIHPRDCIKINDEPLQLADYTRLQSSIDDLCSGNCSVLSMTVMPTNFERLTVCAFCAFAEAQVDIAVIECGMGGLLDATNVLPHSTKLACVISSIDMDHVEYLGPSLSDICMHKVGIVKGSNGVVIVGPQTCKNRDIVIESVRKHCESVGNSNLLVCDCPSLSKQISNGFNVLDNQEFSPGCLSKHNMKSALACIMGIQMLISRNEYDTHVLKILQQITMKDIINSFRETKMKGRFDIIGYNGMEMIVDGAHNVPAFNHLKLQMEMHGYSNRKKLIIFGCGEQKNYTEMLKNIINLPNDMVFFTAFSQPDEMPWIRCKDPSTMKFDGSSYQNYPNIATALNEALNFKHSHLIIITGSLYLVSDFYRGLETPELISR